jgi:hypothetical protein
VKIDKFQFREDFMKKTLIFYKPEYADLAIKLRDNYRAHDHDDADIVSEEEHDDIEYAEKMHYDEAVFIEDSDSVTVQSAQQRVRFIEGGNPSR